MPLWANQKFGEDCMLLLSRENTRRTSTWKQHASQDWLSQGSPEIVVHVHFSFYCCVVIETLDEMNDMYSEAILTTDASSFLVRLFVNLLFWSITEIKNKKNQVCWWVHLSTEWLVRLFVNPLLWSTTEITKMLVCWRVHLSTEWLVRLFVNPLFWSTTEITKMLVCWWVHLSTEWLAFNHLICIFWKECCAVWFSRGNGNEKGYGRALSTQGVHDRECCMVWLTFLRPS
jgi:hypothetical protein